MPDIDRSRWKIALNRVAQIERKSNALKGRLLPKNFSYSKRSAWSTPVGLESLPADQQHALPGTGRVRARVRAESVLIGKFDVQAEVRLRAFYPHNGLSIRYQTGGNNNGIIRTVNAFEKVREYAPHLMPTVYDHGTILDGRGAYLIEETVVGESATRSELESIIFPLATQLHAVHQGAGVTQKYASQALGRRAPELWNEFVELQNINPELDEKVRQLLKRDDLLEVSLTHGDLVNSNILIHENNFVLVDWEWSMIKPIAFDMAKIIINVSHFEKVLEDMQTGLGGYLGIKKSHYTFREQVALALVQTLTFYKRQSIKARKAKRTGALQRQTKKRLNALERLLAVH